MKKKNNYLTIAVDFDGTCVTHEYPNVGKDIGAVPVLKELVNLGHKLILFTMRDGEQLEDAINWFKDNDITLYSVGINPSQKNWTQSNKCYANLYIDDAALGCPLIYPNTKNEKGEDDRPYVDWNRISQMLFENKVELTAEDLLIKKFHEDGEWGSLHDVVYEVLDKQMTNKELETLFRSLPSYLKDDAFHWGLSDSVVRDNIYEYLETLK
jgi:hypothetical protein